MMLTAARLYTAHITFIRRWLGRPLRPFISTAPVGTHVMKWIYGRHRLIRPISADGAYQVSIGFRRQQHDGAPQCLFGHVKYALLVREAVSKASRRAREASRCILLLMMMPGFFRFVWSALMGHSSTRKATATIGIIFMPSYIRPPASRAAKCKAAHFMPSPPFI